MYILIVDDVDFMRARLSRVALQHGYISHTAYSIQSAKSALNKGVKFSKAFVDLNLMHESGLDVVEMLRDFNPEMDITVISGSQFDSDVVERLYSLGVTSIICKPFSEERIRSEFTKPYNRTIV